MNLSYKEILEKHQDQLEDSVEKITTKKNNATRGKGYHSLRKHRQIKINRRATPND